MLDDSPPRRHRLLRVRHEHHGVLEVDDLALIKPGLELLAICAACLIGTCDWINAHHLQASHKQ
jgi:hypothetical protein